MLRGYDIDRTLTAGVQPEPPYVIISGRTWAEYNEVAMHLAQSAPVYIRGVGEYGNHQHAGEFKAAMINMLGVTEFYEDREDQIAIIRERCPDCVVIKV